MRDYPKGAIHTINELVQYADKPVWHVSKTHSGSLNDLNHKEHLTGRIGAKACKSSKGFYYWYECKHEPTHQLTSHSLEDANVIENSYNDWFLFPLREDAEAYLNG